MLAVVAVLAIWVYSLHGLQRAMTSGLVLYFFLISTLAIGRKSD